MADFNFPVFKTKIDGATQKFVLENPAERRAYFKLKCGDEIEKLREYLDHNSFVGFLLGPKNSGKGTHTKMFMEAVGSDRVAHISAGDIVRMARKELENEATKNELIEYLQKKYRGFVKVEDAVNVILGHDTQTLLPTEVILTLVERQIRALGNKAIFIDGFPRNLDQISYSLYFRELMGYRDDPDFFVFIDVPETIIEERMSARVICPVCQTPRSLKLLKTNKVGYDADTKEFYLICDNPSCTGFGTARLIEKEGDQLGIEALRGRIEIDKKIMHSLLELQGVPKIYLRNAVPVKDAQENIDDYEITPEYTYGHDADGNIKITEVPWVINNDSGEPCYSLLPAAVGVSLIKQLTKTLGL